MWEEACIMYVKTYHLFSFLPREEFRIKMKASGHHRKQKAKINVFPFFFLPKHMYKTFHGQSVEQVDTLNFHTQAIN